MTLSNSISVFPQTIWNCIPSILSQDRSFIAKIKVLSNQKDLHWSPARQELVLQALSAPHYHSCLPHLKVICKQLKPLDLHQLLKATLRHLDPSSKNIVQEMQEFENFKQLLNLEQIEAAIRSENPSFENSLKTANDMLAYAKYYLHLIHPPTLKPLLNQIIFNTIWAIETAIDSTLHIFGFYQLGTDVNSGTDAQFRLEAVLTIIAAVSACVTLAVTITGDALLSITFVGAGIALLSALLALYFKFLKPTPRTIQGLQNFTAQALEGKIETSQGIQHYVDQIAETIITSKTNKPKLHPLLIGRSGVGKTEIMKAFAKAVADNCYPELAGMQVFYINMADLIGGRVTSLWDSPPSLEKIKERIKYRRDNVILIFDEVHQASKGEMFNRGNLAEKLKTMLDDGAENFPHVIAGTTDEEFIEYILNDNDSLVRRFKQIPIQEMSRTQTITILNKTILKQKGIRASLEAIEAAYDLSSSLFPERPQPYMACRILAQAITKVKGKNQSDLPAHISTLEAELEKNLSTCLLKPGIGLWENSQVHKLVAEEQARLSVDLTSLKETFKKEKIEAHKTQQLFDQLEIQKQRLCLLATKLEKTQTMKPQHLTPLLKDFALLSQYSYRAFEETVQSHLTKNNSLGQIDLSLIRQIVEQEKTLKEQRESMLKKVRKRKTGSSYAN